VAQLCRFQDEIEALNTRGVIISFGSPPLAQKWIEETQATFPILIDPEMISYRAFGLENSLARSWSPKIWFEYARLMARGRKWRGIQGDSGQLGGDFIVDRTGIIRMAFRSHDPADRPSVDDIVEVLREINDHSEGMPS
jgi:peroxiredoxin